ncbi:MAG: Hpt domain-containing protein [Oscillospiraceae bacterium]|nr:Hpt domain-containing protein [Oscillospiraceae bacterium]
MTIQECYQQFGGDFDEVKNRLPSEILIKKFIAKFLDDSSFSDLHIAMEEGNREKAFSAAHTLKGVCSNLSITRLFLSASKLTELLRVGTESLPADADIFFEEVRRDYELTVSTIRSYLDDNN